MSMIDGLLDVSRAGMQNERLRMEAASQAIALANQAISPDRARDISGFHDLVSAGDGAWSGPVRTVHDPAHPYADKDGNVHYPSVDLAQEMTTMLGASRGYEANVRSFNVLRGIALKALEIGSR